MNNYKVKKRVLGEFTISYTVYKRCFLFFWKYMDGGFTSVERAEEAIKADKYVMYYE